MKNLLYIAILEASLAEDEPKLLPGHIKIYDPIQLIVANLISVEEATSWDEKKCKVYKHPGWCKLPGCPQARQVNGSKICRHHANIYSSV